MAEPIVRDYTIDDLYMLERAQVFHNTFLIDKAAFVADFPNLDDPFAADFQTAIDTADAIPSAAEVEGQIVYITEQLNDLLPTGQKALQKLYVYVEEAWNSKGKETEFGRGQYLKSRNSHVKMKELLELANRVAEIPANKTALLAVGYTQAAITELKTISDSIDALNEQQEDMLNARGLKTEQRIIAYNAVWGFMKRINKASKVTFIDSPAKLNEYMLYPTESHSLPKPQGLVAIENNPGVASLSWDLVIEAESYKIYYSEVNLGEPSGSFAEIGDVTVTNFETPIVPMKRNYWKIKAFNTTTSSAYSDEVWLEGVV